MILLLIASTSTAIAYSDTILDRPQLSYDVNDATEGNPIFLIDEQGPYPSGTDNVEFLTLNNGYDESISVTIELSNDNWQYSDGSQTRTFQIAQYSQENINVDTTGPTRTCAEEDDRRTYEYTYSVNSNSLTIFETTNTVQVCAPGGGGPPGGGGGPP